MMYNKTYNIPIAGLNRGVHHFDYHIDGTFFEPVEQTPIRDSDVTVGLRFDKHNNFFELGFHIQGGIEVQCDRCLEYFELPIDKTFELIIKYAEQPTPPGEANDAEITYISPETTALNITQEIYDYIHLCIPMQKTHPDGACDKKALRLLDKLSPDHPDADHMDPRWEKLRDLKSN